MSTRLASILRNVRDAAVAAGFVAALGVLVAPTLKADGRNHAKVTILEGEAWRVSAGGDRAALEKGGVVYEGETVETGEKARLELTVEDGSAIRLGPSSKLQLKNTYFGSKGEKNFSAKLFFGRVWTKVAGIVGGESKFEIETDNAVAGVRGTTFRVDAATDRSVLVRVYAGSVAMAPGAGIPTGSRPAGTRKQVKGPSQISKQQWETLVGKMMQLAVSADGTPGKPTPFTDADDAGDEWALWNRGLDGE